MRRTTFLGRSVRWALLLGVTLALAAGVASAQQNVPVLVVPVGTTKKVQMSKKQPIMVVNNESPKVCRVQALADDPTAVLVTGLAGGTARITFTDANKASEILDITVTTDDDLVRAQLRDEFLKQIRLSVPGARIDVNINSRATIVSGTAPDGESIRVIGETARKTFGGDVVLAVALPGQEAAVSVPRVQTVELEVLVAIVNRSEARNMTFNWVLNRDDYFISSILGPSLPLNFANAIATSVTGASQSANGSGTNLNVGFVGSQGSFSTFFEALRTEGLAKIMSEPRIIALSGQRASIVSGGETPIVMATSVGSPSTVQYKPFGTNVEFTPLVLENGKIQLEVYAELSNINAANGINVPGVTAPGFDTRRARSVVQLEDGQTLAIGGLIQNIVNGTVKKVPLLGDIPFLGVAFSSTAYREVEEELIILVTPRLIDAMDCTQIPRRLPGRETRSPDDFELFLTQILEAPRGQREVFQDHRYRGAHMNGPTASVYPCGDSNGHGWNRGCGIGGCGKLGHKCSSCATGRCGSTTTTVAPGAVRTSMNVDVPITNMPVGQAEGSPLPVPASLPIAPITDGPTLPPISYDDGRLPPATIGPLER